MVESVRQTIDMLKIKEIAHQIRTEIFDQCIIGLHMDKSGQ